MKTVIAIMALAVFFGGCAVRVHEPGVTVAPAPLVLEAPFFVFSAGGPYGYWDGGFYHGRHYPRGHYYRQHEWQKHGYKGHGHGHGH